MSENKRYYWLKLPENFFDAVDDETISYIEEMEGGQAYVLFYLKLLCKALRTDGVLIRYIGTNCIPYDDTSLARLTNTPVDTVHCAVKVLMEVGLLRRMDSGELFLTQMKEFAGSETDKAIAMRKSRAKARLEGEGNNVTQALPSCYPDVTQSKRKSKEIDIEKEKEREEPSALSIPEMRKACTEKGLSESLAEKVLEWCEYRMENYEDTFLPKRFNTVISQVLAKAKKHGDDAVIDQIGTSIGEHWKGMHLDKLDEKKGKRSGGRFNQMETHEYDFEALEKVLTGGNDGQI